LVGKVWAIPRIALTSLVKKATKARLDSLSLAEAKQEYLDVAGLHAATTLATTHATYNKGQGAAIQHFNTTTMKFLERGLMRQQEKKWFGLATNCDLHGGSKVLCRLNRLAHQ